MFLASLMMAFLLVHPAKSQGEGTEAEQVARRAFPRATRFAHSRFHLGAGERDSLRARLRRTPRIDSLNLSAIYAGSNLLGHAVTTNVLGKDQPITFCIVVDRALAVKDMQILIYREPYGGEVRNASWLRQFFGKTPAAGLRPGRDIRNITGATISVRSVTLGVQDILTALQMFSSRLSDLSEEQ